MLIPAAPPLVLAGARRAFPNPLPQLPLPQPARSRSFPVAPGVVNSWRDGSEVIAEWDAPGDVLPGDEQATGEAGACVGDEEEPHGEDFPNEDDPG